MSKTEAGTGDRSYQPVFDMFCSALFMRMKNMCVEKLEK